MSSSLGEKVVLITRRTRLEELVAQYNTESQTAFVIESKGGNFKEYKLEHQSYYESVTRVESGLKDKARLQMIERNFLPNYIFGPSDIIVVIGQDGLVANTLKYLKGQPVIAINPDPARFDGILLPFEVDDIESIFSDVLKQNYQSKRITMAKAVLNDGQELIAVNDLFIGPRTHTSARYEISVNSQSEVQSSSGIIVSTGLGSSGWMKSIMTGAAGILNKTMDYDTVMPWDGKELKFAVREPFPSNTTGSNLIYGEINKLTTMKINSLMSDNGVIFSDGMVNDFIEFNSGSAVELSIADNEGNLLV